MKKIVCIGDSLTYGFGVSKNHSWLYLLENRFPKNLWINKGINGDTTIGMINRFYEDVIDEKPNVVIIMGGSNDFLSHKNVEATLDNIKIMVEDSLANNITPIVGIPPFIVGPMAMNSWDPYCDYSLVNSKLELYKNLLEDYCTKENLLILNFYNIFKNLSLNSKIEDFYTDGLHLNPKGQKEMFYLIEDLIINNDF
ncbi:GDSL-type esterase/lipase family protein [Clostridium sp.]|uniref:GDSL-type esterase/lipase family protein n=1 Tax=Clostridium sp. TaxID=1506 RepID=UPI0034644529